MPIDSDIAGADELGLRRIAEQTRRDGVRANMLFLQQNGDVARDILPPAVELRLEIVRAIGANYMKPSTATLDASITADAINDARRLKAAVDEVYRIVMGDGAAPAPGTLTPPGA